MQTYSLFEYDCIALPPLGALHKMAGVAVITIRPIRGKTTMGKKQRKHAQSVSDETNNLALNIRRTAVSLAVAAALPGEVAVTVDPAGLALGRHRLGAAGPQDRGTEGQRGPAPCVLEGERRGQAQQDSADGDLDLRT